MLNTTVASIALTVNEVLTHSYNAIYGSSDDSTELILVTAPLTATAEVQALYEAKIIDYETAMPAALHSLGCSAEEIGSALDRRRALEKQEVSLQKQRDVTEVDELKARSKVAKTPPQPTTTGAGAAPAKPKTPPKPASDSGND